MISENSLQQAELFIAKQTTLLDCNEPAALSPYDLQQSIKHLLKINPNLAQAVSLVVKSYTYIFFYWLKFNLWN